eukprot:NODE_467_length_8122_cov_0.425776.p2 type:complete len:314 gc:universal NODE_467_length_8122_cov_0.425776:1463-2404(+)
MQFVNTNFQSISTLLLGLMTVSVSQGQLNQSKKDGLNRIKEVLSEYEKDKNEILYGKSHEFASENIRFLKSVSIKGFNGETSVIPWDAPFTTKQVCQIYFNAHEWFKNNYQKTSHSSFKSRNDFNNTLENQVNSSRSYLRNQWHHLLNIHQSHSKFKLLYRDEEKTTFSSKALDLVGIRTIDSLLTETEKSDIRNRYIRVHRWVKPFDVVMGYTKKDGDIYKLNIYKPVFQSKRNEESEKELVVRDNKLEKELEDEIENLDLVAKMYEKCGGDLSIKNLDKVRGQLESESKISDQESVILNYWKEIVKGVSNQ